MWSSSTEGANSHPIRSGYADWGVLPQDTFLRVLCLERKRTERSGRRFVLALLTSDVLLRPGDGNHALARVLAALAQSIRETDVLGWYAEETVLGVIFTEVGDGDGRQIAHALLAKITSALGDVLSVDEIGNIQISFHSYPERSTRGLSGSSDHWLYPDLTAPSLLRRVQLGAKRAIDIVGSLSALILGLPVFCIIASLVKLTSPGPILFRQVRIGRDGRTFTFLKFRSMLAASDHHVHEEYMKLFIAGGSASKQAARDQSLVFKITDDPRVTPIGKFLRKSSLDELPQFVNVLMGQMSIVGPRPPIPYEVECYDTWHRRRLLAVKPGITGLWQVTGRSRVSFDEMVRLDLAYATSWSPWLDTKILLQTPRAVLAGAGAY